MSKKQIHQLDLSDEQFQLIKKNKRKIELRLNDEKIQKIKVGDTIAFVNLETKRFLKRTVKKLHPYPNFKELYKNIKKRKLGYQRKESASYKDMEKYYVKEDIEKYGVVGIELKTKKKIIRKIFISLFIIILLIIGIYFIKNKMTEFNNRKINNAINELSKDKINYVFIEINPSFVLTIKDNKVDDIACLNDDCMSLYDDIDITNKNINDSFKYLYRLVQNKDFDVSNGVKVKITNNDLEIETKDYITVEYIDEETKNELLSNVKNNEKIKDNSNYDYYTNLWNELKKDRDYDNVYSCSMNDDELECYFIMDALKSNIVDEESFVVNYIKWLDGTGQKIASTFDKFGIRHHNTETYINNIKYNYQPLFTLQYVPYKNVLQRIIIETLDIPEEFCSDNDTNLSGCQFNDGIELLRLEDLNLLNPTASLDKVITHRYGLKEKTLQNYELWKLMNE